MILVILLFRKKKDFVWYVCCLKKSTPPPDRGNVLPKQPCKVYIWLCLLTVCLVRQVNVVGDVEGGDGTRALREVLQTT